MGTPIRPVQVVLGWQFDAETEFTHEERLYIIREVVQWCVSSLKYMPGFLEIGVLVKGERRNSTLKTSDDVLKLHGDLTTATRVIFLASANTEVNEKRSGSPETGEKILDTTELWLADNGTIIKWKYRHKIERGNGTKNREIALNSVFTPVSDEELGKIFEAKIIGSIIFGQILSSLKTMVGRCVKERKERLAAMEKLLSRIRGATSRISTLYLTSEFGTD